MEAGNQTRPDCHSLDESSLSDGNQPYQAELHHEDLGLVRRLLARDESAWRAFVEQYHRLILHRIHAAAREIRFESCDSDLLEEVCADVFAQLVSRNMDSLRRYSGRSKLSTWLAVVVRRTALRGLTRQAQRARQPDTAELDQLPVPGPTEAAAREDHRKALQSALEQLSTADQEVLKLYYDHQQSYAEIGSVCGISENSVGPRLNRARSRLRAILKQDDDES